MQQHVEASVALVYALNKTGENCSSSESEAWPWSASSPLRPWVGVAGIWIVCCVPGLASRGGDDTLPTGCSKSCPLWPCAGDASWSHPSTPLSRRGPRDPSVATAAFESHAAALHAGMVADTAWVASAAGLGGCAEALTLGRAVDGTGGASRRDLASTGSPPCPRAEAGPDAEASVAAATPGVAPQPYRARPLNREPGRLVLALPGRGVRSPGGGPPSSRNWRLGAERA